MDKHKRDFRIRSWKNISIIKNIVDKSIINNKILPISFRSKYLTKTINSPYLTRPVNYCKLTGKPRGIITRYGISRIMFKNLADSGLLPGIRRSSW
jgi:ribosomal protein S14